MNDKTDLERRQRRGVALPHPPQRVYNVTLTDMGKWLHSPNTDFLFAYIENTWSSDVKNAAMKAFESALSMSTTIKTAVKQTSGQDVVNGLYLLDQSAMTKAMNTIDGMGLMTVNQQSEKGTGTAVEINGAFFSSILGGLGGDVTALLTYLTKEMGDYQEQVKISAVTQNFGTVIGTISVMPVLNLPVTTFQHVFSTSNVAQWLVSVPCGNPQQQSYDYDYTVVRYNYVPPAP